MKIQEVLEAKKNKLTTVRPDDFDDTDDLAADPDSDKIPHIVMQLRQALDVEGDLAIKFKDGTKAKIPLEIIQKFLLKYLELKPSDKEEMQNLASESLSGFKDALTTNYFSKTNKSIYAYK